MSLTTCPGDAAYPLMKQAFPVEVAAWLEACAPSSAPAGESAEQTAAPSPSASAATAATAPAAMSEVAVGFFIRLTAGAGSNGDCRETDGNGQEDNDGDALCDNWETEGIDGDGDGDVDLQLYDADGNGSISSSERGDLNVPDVFVKID